MAHSNILIVCEGFSEKKFFEKMSELYIKGRSCSCFVFHTNLYVLYDKLMSLGVGTDFSIDEIDLPLMLKSLTNDAEELKILDKPFELIYLCFDADFQAAQFDEAKIRFMVDTFNNDSDQGQIFINYPMSESLYDNKRQWDTYKDRDIALEGLTSSTYSICVGKRGWQSPPKNNCLCYTKEQFELLLNLNISKARKILRDQFSIVQIEDFYMGISQKKIFDEIYKVLKKNNTILILNTSIFFLVDYVGVEFFKKLFF